MPAVSFSWDITLGQGITAVVGAFGLVGLVFAYKQLGLVGANSLENARATKARFVLDLNKWFNEDPAERSFFYKLDYSKTENAFKFDPTRFPHSEEERLLDGLLYKLNHVGELVRRGVVVADDLGWVKFIVGATMKNEQVLSYLEWLRSPEQVPDHSSFNDALILFRETVRHC
jgi:hypothetical protein